MKKYCVDCGKEISRGAKKRCKSCAKKGKLNNEYKHGKYCEDNENHCIDCNKKILGTSIRCSSCHSSRIAKERFKNPKNHFNWQGGLSFEEYGMEFDSALKETIRQRDGYKCKKCGCSQLENGRQLDVHHIDYNKRNNKLNNLISLCVRCHRKTGFNRDYWYAYFTYLMKEAGIKVRKIKEEEL